MAILVTGGAGYIGSHTVKFLRSQNEEVVVLDNLSKGHKEAVGDAHFYEGDIRDKDLIAEICRKHDIEGVVHFAAYSLVGESMKEPFAYYTNNVAGTLELLKALVANKVKNLVFSSTAAVYGEPDRIPIEETDKTIPTNPYGETKLAIEKMLKWSFKAYGLNSICLRYFNAAGADPEGQLGEDHHPETHLIPLILSVALGQRDTITVYGDDYDTSDGTCVRDYIHVLDLASAHYQALKKLQTTKGALAYNLGNGAGFSVMEVIKTARLITGKDIPVVKGSRRLGDPAVLVASPKKAEAELKWQRQFSSLENIVKDAWQWHKSHPQGYR